MASTLLAMASNLIAMASYLLAMASTRATTHGLHRTSDRLQPIPTSDGLQPSAFVCLGGAGHTDEHTHDVNSAVSFRLHIRHRQCLAPNPHGQSYTRGPKRKLLVAGASLVVTSALLVVTIKRSLKDLKNTAFWGESVASPSYMLTVDLPVYAKQRRAGGLCRFHFGFET